MNKKFKLIIVIFFLGMIVLASCSTKLLWTVRNETAENAKDLDSDLILVGFSQLGSESDWRTANTKSIQNALTQENGFSLIFSNGRQSQANQIKAIRSFIFQEVDYIVLAPVTEGGWDTVLEEAKEAGIPVIIVDRMIDTDDDSLYIACVGTDKYAEGRKAGLWLEEELLKESTASEPIASEPTEELDETGSAENSEVNEETDGMEEPVHIVVLEGTIDSTSQIGRSKGFEDIAKRHDNWTILAHESADFTKAKGKEVMTKFLQDYPKIDVLVSQNDDMTFGAIEAIQEAGLTCGIDGQIKIISFDAVSEAFDKMEAGLINADVECNPLQGPMIAEILRRIEKGEDVDKISYVDEEVFTAENAATERIGRKY